MKKKQILLLSNRLSLVSIPASAATRKVLLFLGKPICMVRALVLNPPSQYAKNVVRDLIYGCWCKGKRIGGAKIPPINLLYIASILKQEGHEVVLVDALAEQKPLTEISQCIDKYDIVIISTSTMSFSEDIGVLAEFKRIKKSIITIIFGSHPTFMPEHALEFEKVDIIVRREPEYIIKDVVNALETGDDSWKKVGGIGYRDGEKKVLNDDYPLIDNLDSLPFIDRSLLPKDIHYFNPLIRRMPYTTIMTSRGCPAKCNFCTVPVFYGQKVRARSAENVLTELELIQNQGYKEVWVRDETFTVFKKRNIHIFNEMIDRGLDLSWICNARVGTVDRDMVVLMKKAGCHTIKFGVESGVQQILDNIKKGINISQTRKTFKLAHEVGINTHAHIMLGCPGDSRDTINATIRFVKEIDPTTVTFGICTPYPGTALFDEVAHNNPNIQDGSSCGLNVVHEHAFFNEYFTDLSGNQLEKAVTQAYRSFYFRPQYILKTLSKVRDVNDLKRLVLAGSNVFEFGMGY